MKIAIIDDDPVCHFLYIKLIGRISQEHQILRFQNGLQAIEFFILNASTPDLLPDVVLLDINMPVMNGWQFLENFRTVVCEGYSPDIYLVSSSTDQRDVESSYSFSELKGFLQKPLSPLLIAQILNNEPVTANQAYTKAVEWLPGYNTSVAL